MSTTTTRLVEITPKGPATFVERDGSFRSERQLAAEQFPAYSCTMPSFEIRRRSIFVLLLVTACGGDGGDGGMSDGTAGSAGAVGMAGSTSASAGDGDAAVICRDGILCGYQLADQASCEDLFELFFDDAELAACRACVDAEACATELDACQGVCTLQ